MKLYNGIELPEIGFGTFPSKEELVTNIKIANDCGFQMIDTSEDYYNMEYIGEGLKRIASDKKIFIITKVSWPHEIFDMQKTINNYIKTLQVEAPIDCILLHFPTPFVYLDMWKELEKAYEMGLCKAIGVCNFEVKHLKYLMLHSRIKPMINQIELHPTLQQCEIVQYCQKNNIQIMAYSPLGRMNGKLMNNTVLNDIANHHNKTIPQVILRWDVQKGFIPIPSARTENHIKSNIDIFDFELSSDEISRIDGLECGNRIRHTVKSFYTQKQCVGFLKTHIRYLMLHAKK